MTRDEAREFAKLVQAYADGRDVQFHRLPGTRDPWHDCLVSPAFDALHCKYRIKPELREWWVVPSVAHAARYKDEAEDMAEAMDCPTTSIVHVREVMP
jgi:hypothetical protein